MRMVSRSRWGLAGALLLLMPGAARAATASPRAHAPTPTPARKTSKASAPRIAGHIAYVGANGNIFVIGPNGSDKRALTNNGASDPPYNAPLPSPKGADAGILAVRFATPSSDVGAFQPSATSGLYLVSPSGGTRRLDADVPRGYAWAPDGASVVYEEGYLSETALVVLDPRTGHRRTLACDPAFRLLGVTPVGNRAVGIQGNDLVAESLSDGTTRGLTSYGAKAGVWQDLAALAPAGRAVVYAEAPGTTLVSIDLRTGRTARASLAGAASTIAPSPDASTFAYAVSGAGGATQALLRAGKGVASLRDGASFTTHAFAPNGAALTYSVEDNGLPYVYAAPTACPAACATRLDFGRDAAWGP